MPPIYRHIVPNIPALTADNGKPCYRAGAPSCQRKMRGSVVWYGDPDYTAYTLYPMTVTAAEINSAISAAVAANPGDDEFFYGVAGPTFGDYDYHYPSASKRIKIDISVDLVYDATGWFWQADLKYFNAERPQYPERQPPYDFWVGPTICVSSHVGAFQSAHMDAAFRLGNGIRLDFVGLSSPWTEVNTWRNTALNGCYLYVSAQWA